MKKDNKRESRKLVNSPESKEKYHSPQLVSYGDFGKLTRMKGTTGKDSASAPIKTRVGAG